MIVRTTRPETAAPTASSGTTSAAVWARLERWAPWLLFAVALALRLFRLGSEGLWVDEGFSLRDAAGLTAHGRYRPLYYLVLAAWQHFGSSEAWLRMPSALFGAGAVALLYLVARRLAGHRAATVAALAMAVATPELDHSQEVRMYAMGSFLGLLAVLAMLRWLDRRRPGWLAAHAVTVVAAALTTAGSLLLTVPAAVYAAWRLRADRAARTGLLLAWVVVAAALASQVAAVRRGLDEFGGERRWIESPSLGEPFYFVGRRFIPNLEYLGAGLPAVALTKTFALGALALAILAFANPRRDPQATVARPLALGLAVVVAGVWVYSHLALPLWMARTFHPVAPAAYLLVAIGLTQLFALRPRLGLAAAVLFAAVPLVAAAKYYAMPERDDWRGALAWVRSLGGAEATVCVIDPIYFPIVRYYYPAAGCALDTHLRLGELATLEDAAEVVAQIPPSNAPTYVVTRAAKRFGALPERFAEELTREGRLLGRFAGLKVHAFAVAPEPRSPQP